ncbi:hypothetical protein DFH11DRAFT_701808 [Phellopilus nigrolimitatus]|nr:hypothetical protein DFH11DRAFT_701808 [Phellopilus nigrolimitatus]
MSFFSFPASTPSALSTLPFALPLLASIVTSSLFPLITLRVPVNIINSLYLFLFPLRHPRLVVLVPTHTRTFVRKVNR